MCPVCIGIGKDLGIEKDIRIVGGPTDEKLLHPRLIFQAGIAILVNQLLNAVQIAFNDRGDVNDVGHVEAQSSVLR